MHGVRGQIAKYLIMVKPVNLYLHLPAVVADVASKCLHVTSSNTLFCTHYVDDVNYRFPLTSMGK